ncbi:MAG: hypothetical protein U0003_02785 [Vampirovibrionales bacterium]
MMVSTCLVTPLTSSMRRACFGNGVKTPEQQINEAVTTLLGFPKNMVDPQLLAATARDRKISVEGLTRAYQKASNTPPTLGTHSPKN